MRREGIVARLVARSIDVGILCQKRQLVLEEIDSIDRRARTFPKKPRARHLPMRNLDEEAEQLEVQIRQLEDAVKKDRAQLTNLLTRN